MKRTPDLIHSQGVSGYKFEAPGNDHNTAVCARSGAGMSFMRNALLQDVFRKSQQLGAITLIDPDPDAYKRIAEIAASVNHPDRLSMRLNPFDENQASSFRKPSATFVPCAHVDTGMSYKNMLTVQQVISDLSEVFKPNHGVNHHDREEIIPGALKPMSQTIKKIYQ
jgi:hypothetical protein